MSDRGFTADVQPRVITVKRGKRGCKVPVLLAFGVSIAIMLAVLPSLGKTDTLDGSSSSDTSEGLRYDFRVHALNLTSMVRAAGGTIFKFRTADLPFDFSTVCFGDHRSDPTFSRTYYGGSGILVDAAGTSAVMTLKESTGRFISCVSYSGQAQVVFNGRVESVTYPTNTTTYHGTDQIVQDWRNGTWDPQDGVLVEHPSNIILSGAKFYLMTLEPSGITDIPEFDLVPMVGAVAAISLLSLWIRGRAAGTVATVR